MLRVSMVLARVCDETKGAGFRHRVQPTKHDCSRDRGLVLLSRGSASWQVTKFSYFL